MSVSIYGIKEIRFRRASHKHGGEEPAIWMDCNTEAGDKIEMTARIPAIQFIRKMRLILTNMETCVLNDINFDLSLAREEEMDVTRVEAKTE